MNKVECTILKFAFSGKYLEVWLDGLPFSKISDWDDVEQKVIQTDLDQWNFSCKPYEFKEWFVRDTLNKIDFGEILLFNGWNFFRGKKCLYNKETKQLEFSNDNYEMI